MEASAEIMCVLRLDVVQMRSVFQTPQIKDSNVNVQTATIELKVDASTIRLISAMGFVSMKAPALFRVIKPFVRAKEPVTMECDVTVPTVRQ